MSTSLQDMIEPGVVSNCCGAPVMLGSICMDCREHCDPECEHTPVWQDLSFDHEFGTEKGGNWVCSKCGEVVEEPE